MQDLVQVLVMADELDAQLQQLARMKRMQAARRSGSLAHAPFPQSRSASWKAPLQPASQVCSSVLSWTG